MSEAITLTKRDVARRQLNTAVSLFFENKDSVSVHTLGYAASSVINDLCKHQGIKSSLNLIEGGDLEPEVRKLVIKARNSMANYFKHADQDVEISLKNFSDTTNDHMLWLCLNDYFLLMKKLTIELQIFQLWYIALYEPDWSSNYEIAKAYSTAAKELFANIDTKTRVEQKLEGLRKLTLALENSHILYPE